MKTCTSCNKKKSFEDFCKRSDSLDGYNGKCKSCVNSYNKEHYVRNKKAYVTKARKWSKHNCKDNRHKMLNYLKDKRCIDCGETHLLCLQFDHVKGKKRMNVSEMVQTHCWKTILEEIDKCEIRCANCHCKKTSERNQDYRWQYLENAY